MADLFPNLKIDLQPPVSSESPDWLAGFPQHAKQLRPLVGGLERVKSGAVGLMEHVSIVRDLAKWINSLFQTGASLESCVELHCTHRGMRTNCVTVELFFQTMHLSQRFVLLAHCGQTGTTWLFPSARQAPDRVNDARIEFVRQLVGLQTFTLGLFRDRVTEKPYALYRLIDLAELEDYYRYTRAYGFWAILHSTLKGRHCADPEVPAPVSVIEAPEYTQALGDSLQAALECQRTLADIQAESFCIGETCNVPLPKPLLLENTRIKKPDPQVTPLNADTRWEVLVHPMVLALRAEWANCCSTTEVTAVAEAASVFHRAQESMISAYLVQQLLRYGFNHPSRLKWDPSATRMIGIGMPDKFPTAGAVTQLLKSAEGLPKTLTLGVPIQ